jgi:hypothetical protein
VARKPRDHKAAYARRTAGTAKGSPERRAARGHRPPAGKTEYAVRRESSERRAAATGQLTDNERAAVRRFVRQQNALVGLPRDYKITEALAYATREGMEKFRAEVAYVRYLKRESGPLPRGDTDKTTIDDLIRRSLLDRGLPVVEWYFYNPSEAGRRRMRLAA